MKKNKFNKEILSEELKKFRLLTEYTFYTEKEENDDNLLIGNIDETPDEPEDNLNFDDANVDNTKMPNQGQAAPQPQSGGQEAGAAPLPSNEPVEAPAGEGDQSPPTDDMDNTFDDGIDEPPVEDDSVDIDVTQLVHTGEAAEKAAKATKHKTNQLLAKFNELEGIVSTMTNLSSKIDSLEKEVVKRNPTPTEKLELRSLDSAPFNIKLKDFWSDVDGYDTGQQEKKEYVLTKDDIDSTYQDSSVKNSFNVDDDLYDEEDI